MRAWVPVVLLLATASACAPARLAPEPTASAGPRQCFSAGMVNGFRVVDSQTVDLNVGAGRVFRLSLLGVCPDVRDAVSVGVRTRGGSSYICDDNDVELVVPSTAGPRACLATGLRQRSPEELAAERAARP